MNFMKAMKKLIALICAAVMLMSCPVTMSHADDDIEVYLNGNWIYFEDQQPVIIDGRTLVPMRAIFEAMGAQVDWYGDTQSIDIIKDSISLTLYINHDVIYGNFSGSPSNIAIDVPPQIINGRTMVPLRAISETIGAEVDWNGNTQTVYIWAEKSAGEFNNGRDTTTFDNTTKDDYYFDAYNNILNLGWYIDEDPYYSDSEVYKFDYSRYDEGIEDEIDTYIEDMRDEGFVRSDTRSGNGSAQYWMYGYGYEVLIVDKYSMNQVEVHISESSSSLAQSTPKPTATPKPVATATPKPTAVPTPEPTQVPAFMYLKDLGYSNLKKDSTASEIKTGSNNSLILKLEISRKKNPSLNVGDECVMYAEYDLNGEYNRLTGILKGTGKSALKIYCDGVLQEQTPIIKDERNLDVDVSGCDTLRIETYGNVNSNIVAASSSITMQNAMLWYD